MPLHPDCVSMVHFLISRPARQRNASSLDNARRADYFSSPVFVQSDLSPCQTVANLRSKRSNKAVVDARPRTISAL